MNEFLENMPTLLKGFWIVGMVSGLFFLLQTIMTFAGGHSDADGVNADFQGDLTGVDAPFQMFTLRNMVNFLLAFGWTGVAFYQNIPNKIALVLLATVVGIAFVALFFLVIKQVLRLNEDNTFNVQHLLHQPGDVYITIPGQMSGKGKVQISLRGSMHELDAMTEGEALQSGTSISVAAINNNILIVQKIA